MKVFTIEYTGGGRPMPPVMAKDHRTAIVKAAKASLGISYFRKHCKVTEIDPKTFDRTYFIVSDGETEQYFTI